MYRFMNSVVLSILSFAATLTPSSAAGYNYLVPPPECSSLIRGSGMGDTVSYRAIRYTDVAWLGNAVMEFKKLQHDIFSSPRFYSPFSQVTNTLSMRLLNPAAHISRPSGETVNYYTATALPSFLAADKSISADGALPAGYGGSVGAAWPVVAGVTAADAWTLSSLFGVLDARANSRVIGVAAITNAYASVAKLHGLKFVSGNTSLSHPSAGEYRMVTDGRETVEHYSDIGGDDGSVNWEKSITVTTNFEHSIPSSVGAASGFELVAYARSERWYEYSIVTNLNQSPVCQSSCRFDFYPYYNSATGVPRTVVINRPVERIYNAAAQDIGSDMSWPARIGTFKRVSCFKIVRHLEERHASRGTSGGQTESATTTEYVLVDTTDHGAYAQLPRTSSYIGGFFEIDRTFVGAGAAKTFLADILGASRLADLSRMCDMPRSANEDEWGYPDYIDDTYREVAYKVSHVWSVSTLKPNYSCRYDGN